MCLNITVKKAGTPWSHCRKECSVAKKGIKTYKVLCRTSKGYVSPYCKTAYCLDNGTYMSDDFKECVCSMTDWQETARFSVYNGIHTYTEDDIARCIANHLSRNDTMSEVEGLQSLVVVECMIPKGARYYKGFDGHGYDCYASDTIKMTRNVIYDIPYGNQKWKKKIITLFSTKCFVMSHI